MRERERGRERSLGDPQLILRGRQFGRRVEDGRVRAGGGCLVPHVAKIWKERDMNEDESGILLYHLFKTSRIHDPMQYVLPTQNEPDLLANY